MVKTANEEEARRRSLAERWLPYRGQFLRFLARRVGNRDTAEDMLQEAYLRMCASRGILLEERQEVAWFFRVLRNLVADHFRKRDSEGRALGRQSAIAHSAEKEIGKERSVCHCVRSQIETLKPEYAEILQKVELEKEAVEDFARSRSLSANHASVRLHRAKIALRERLEITCCGSCASSGCLDCTCPN